MTEIPADDDRRHSTEPAEGADPDDADTVTLDRVHPEQPAEGDD